MRIIYDEQTRGTGLISIKTPKGHQTEKLVVESYSGTVVLSISAEAALEMAQALTSYALDMMRQDAIAAEE